MLLKAYTMCINGGANSAAVPQCEVRWIKGKIWASQVSPLQVGLYCHVNRGGNVREVIRANDPALISVVEALLLEAEIPYQIADQNISILEGGIGAFPRRVLVDDSREEEARQLLVDAGIPPKGMRL
ncbi:DUF2007 domain-containing protein [Microtetraspora malaysiensis]|uniref:putative signal transducing protein n=1 Tax=Microtetraspora malaysiensis TaxID=161358 RepID=UPI003D8F242B